MKTSWNKNILTAPVAVLYSGAVEIRNASSLAVHTARKGVKNYECIALNLPVPVRAGTLPKRRHRLGAFGFCAHDFNLSKLGEIIMSKESMKPAFAVVGKFIYVDFPVQKQVHEKSDEELSADACALKLEQKIIAIMEKYKEKEDKPLDFVPFAGGVANIVRGNIYG